MSLYAKRLESGRFVWPQVSDGAVMRTPAQLGYFLAASTDVIRRTAGDHRRRVKCGC
jgi:hypothetical protein